MKTSSKTSESAKQVEIIEYSPTYSDDFARLNFEWITEYWEVEAHDGEQVENPYESVVAPGGQIFFAIVEGNAVGTVAMIQLDSTSYELAKMAVTPLFQGYKIGDRLMRACIDFAKVRNAEKVVRESNTKLVAAINLYRKYGFKEIPLDTDNPYERANIRMELVVVPD